MNLADPSPYPVVDMYFSVLKAYDVCMYLSLHLS